MSGINSNMSIDPSLAVKAAQDREMVQRKMEIDALRKRMTPEQDPKGKLREACQGFETIFIQKIWEQMRANVPKEGYLHSKQEEMYQSMYDNEFAKKMAQAGGIGLGDMLYEQLSQSLGESSRSAAPRVSPRLPIVPATGSPTSMKYAAGSNGQPAGFEINGQNGVQAGLNPDGRPVKLPAGVRPLYEDFDESANQQAFALPGRGGDPNAYTAMDVSGLRPMSVRQAQAAVNTQAAMAAQPFTATQATGNEANAQTYTAPPAGAATQATATNLTPGQLDFEDWSQEALQQENLRQESLTQGDARYEPAHRPQGSAFILSPEETRVLQEALWDNAGAAANQPNPLIAANRETENS